MEYGNQEEFNPARAPTAAPTTTTAAMIVRSSAFSKPTLSSSSSLLPSPRAAGAGAGARNGMNCFEIPAPSSSPPWVPVVLNPAAHSRPTPPNLQSPLAPPPAESPMATMSSASPFSPAAPAAYRECLRNHAASSGGHAVDGCCEFMPGGGGGGLAASPDAMKCAACGCHRSFHRKELDAGETPVAPYYRLSSNYARGGVGGDGRTPLLLPPPPPPPPATLFQYPHKAPAPFHGHQFGFPASSSGVLAGSSATTESSSEELSAGGPPTQVAEPAPPPATTGKKRFRTKFTAEQKSRMLEFAERAGWRIQRRQDDDGGEVERFCAEIGVRRQVLKVWMHNNKHAVNRRTTTTQQEQPPPPPPPAPAQSPERQSSELSIPMD